MENASFGNQVRRYFEKYPSSRPLKVARIVCSQLRLPLSGREFQMKLNEVRQIKHRVRKRINAIKSDDQVQLERLVNGGLLPSAHRVVGHCQAPWWLADAIVKAARERFGGWFAAGNGRLRSGMLRCKLPARKYRMTFHPRTRRLDVYGGRGRVDFEDFKAAVAGNLSSLLDLSCASALDARLLKEDLPSLLRDLWSGAAAFHIAIPTGGMESVVPFKIRLAYMGITVRHDGSHPSCIEIEVNEPRWVRELLRALEELRGLGAASKPNTTDITKQGGGAGRNDQSAATNGFSAQHLRDLDEEQPHWAEDYIEVPRGLQTVEVSKIIGSVSRGKDFGVNWVPFTKDDRYKVLTESFRTRNFDADESNRSPISLVELSGEYFVEDDGHRRVSIAHRFKLRTVEAEVFKLEPRSREPEDESEMTCRHGLRGSEAYACPDCRAEAAVDDPDYEEENEGRE
jgi:hypothetical protein